MQGARVHEMTIAYPSGTDPIAGALNTDILAVGQGIDRRWIDPARRVRHLTRFEAGAAGRPDLLVLAADAVEVELLSYLASPAGAGLPLLVVVDSNAADAAGLLVSHNVIAFLSPEEAGAGLDAAIAAAALGQGPRLAEGPQTIDHPMHNRFDAVRRDAERIAKTLAELLAERGDLPAPARPIDAPRIRAHIKARRLRERFFPADLFADPAWDILLDLAAARREGVKVSVSSLCIAANVPTTTGLRWIKAMVDRGLLLREPDPHDARRAFIILSAQADRAMDACMEACFNLPGL
jgi:hypothetical protein